MLRSALEAAIERSDEESKAYATQYLGLSHLFDGELSAAEEMLDQAYRQHVALGSKTAAFALTDLAVTVMLTGNVARSIGLYEQVLAMSAADGDPWTRSHMFWGLGVATFLEGDVERAEQAEKDGLDLIARSYAPRAAASRYASKPWPGPPLPVARTSGRPPFRAPARQYGSRSPAVSQSRCTSTPVAASKLSSST